MEESIFPIGDSIIAATQGDDKDLVARGNRGHMGNPGGEDILYHWLDKAFAASPSTPERAARPGEMNKLLGAAVISCDTRWVSRALNKYWTRGRREGGVEGQDEGRPAPH